MSAVGPGEGRARAEARMAGEHDGAGAPTRTEEARRSTLVSVGVNLLLTGMQMAAGLFAGSQALIADAVHSLSDLISDFVVLFASHHSRKGADADHQYGHQRFETAASLGIGILLLAVGVGMLWTAVSKLEHPELIQPVKEIALWVALGALAAKELLFRYMLAVAQRVRSAMLAANAWHARSDAASSLVVALGIGGNMLGVHMLDPIAALVVGLMVSRMGWKFSWEAMHDLMDGAVDAQTVAAIREAMLGTPGVHGLHGLRTRKMGDFVLADVHLEIDGALTVEAGHHIALEARRRAMEVTDVLDVMTHMDPVHLPR